MIKSANRLRTLVAVSSGHIVRVVREDARHGVWQGPAYIADVGFTIKQMIKAGVVTMSPTVEEVGQWRFTKVLMTELGEQTLARWTGPKPPRARRNR